MFQLIIWRYNEHQDIKYYRLKTVTYGTSSAPYLATKCLQHLAIRNATKYPLGASILRDDFYVDDCLSGANSITAALESQRQLNILLKEAGFKLRKWCSNHPQLLNGIAPEDQEINLNLDENSTCAIKTLGLIWLPKSDQLCGRAQVSTTNSVTKE
ncbi:hypothetical protein EVAR_67634_1 [Eumeta japonica]|uniref:Reverse transcriptase domain-containing protein n=1 Tax=Eumeta variegata TaxID=151549 RepID=A0A4C2ADC6_EUMVA|nr:hypothetical protein EVAR_67634_1 [Eumeta japonica]